jgi:hypothetical protein
MDASRYADEILGIRHLVSQAATDMRQVEDPRPTQSPHKIRKKAPAPNEYRRADGLLTWTHNRKGFRRLTALDNRVAFGFL